MTKSESCFNYPALCKFVKTKINMKNSKLKLEAFLSDGLHRKQASSILGGVGASGDPIKPSGPGGTPGTGSPIGDPIDPNRNPNIIQP